MKHVHKKKQIIALRAEGKSLGEIARLLNMGKGNVAYYLDRHERGEKTKQELIEENEQLFQLLKKLAVKIPVHLQ